MKESDYDKEALYILENFKKHRILKNQTIAGWEIMMRVDWDFPFYLKNSVGFAAVVGSPVLIRKTPTEEWYIDRICSRSGDGCGIHLFSRISRKRPWEIDAFIPSDYDIQEYINIERDYKLNLF